MKNESILKTYIGVKEIKATPMTRGEYAALSGRNSILTEKGEQISDDGYFVKYSDGYTSWSPKKQFEEAYHEVGINPLNDTALLMVSKDFKERFKAEYIQLKTRYNGLKTILEKYKNGTLSFTPKCPISIFESQLHAMQLYMCTLEERAEIENIDLND